MNKKTHWNWVWAQSIKERFLQFYAAFNFTYNVILSDSATIAEVNVEMVSFPGTCFNSNFTTDDQRRYMIANAFLYQVTNIEGTVCHLSTDAQASMALVGKKNSYCCTVMAGSPNNTAKCENEVVWNKFLGIINIIVTVLIAFVILNAPVLFLLSLSQPYDYSKSGVKLVRPDTPANPLWKLVWWPLQKIPKAKGASVIYTILTIFIIPGFVVSLYFIPGISPITRLPVNKGFINALAIYVALICIFIISVLVFGTFYFFQTSQKMDIPYLKFIKKYIDPFILLQNIYDKIKSSEETPSTCLAPIMLLCEPCCWKFLESSKIKKLFKVIIYLLIVLLNMLYFTCIIALQILSLVVIIFSMVFAMTIPALVWASATAYWIASKLDLATLTNTDVLPSDWLCLCFKAAGTYLFFSMYFQVIGSILSYVVICCLSQAIYTFIGMLISVDNYLPKVLFGLIVIESLWSHFHSITGKYKELLALIFQTVLKEYQTGRNDFDENREDNHNERNRQDDPQAGLSEGNGQNDSENVEGDKHDMSIVYFDENHVPRVPYDLEADVREQILPEKYTVCITLIKCLCTLAFYTFVFSCIMAFGSVWYGDSSITILIESTVTLLTAIVPKLKSLLSKHGAASQLKLTKIKNRLEDIIREYKKGPGQNQSRNTGTSQDDNGRNHQNRSDRSRVEQNRQSYPQNSENEPAMQNHSGTSQNNRFVSWIQMSSQFTKDGYSRIPGNTA